MGLVIQNRNYKYSAQSSDVICSTNAEQLTPANIIFLKSLGLTVVNDGKVGNIQRTRIQRRHH